MAEFITFLHSENVYFCCVSETHFRANEQFSVPGYRVYSTPRRVGSHGGTAVIVKTRYPSTTTSTQTSSIENTVSVTEVFSKPQSLDAADYNDLLMHHDDIPTIVAGDLNALHHTWNYHTTNTKGRLLSNYIRENNNLRVHAPPEATRYHHADIGNTLDIAISSNCNYDIQAFTNFDLSADHLPVTNIIRTGLQMPLNNVFSP